VEQAASPNEREIRYWNSEATRPWSKSHQLVDRMFAELTSTALDAAAPQAGERVFDIGCGSGTTVLELAERVGPTGYVFGADISDLSVQTAQQRIAEGGLMHAQVSICDLSTADLEPHGFDLAFSRFGVMFFTDPTATLGRLHGAMKPNGRLCFAVFRQAAENPWSTGPLAALRDLLPPQPTPEPEAPGQFSWADPSRVRRILEGAGFQRVELTPHDPEIRVAPAGGAAEATEFAMQIGPVVRAMTNSSLDAPTVRRALQAYFATQDGPRGIVMRGAIWIVRARA